MTKPYLRLALVVLLAACDNRVVLPTDGSVPTDGDTDEDGGPITPPEMIPVLGNGTHSPAGLTITDLATSADGLNMARDLAINPQEPTQLWIVNESTSVLVLSGVGTASQTSELFVGDEFNAGNHFLARPVGIAFGQPGRFATAPREDQPTQGDVTPADFMGPALWDPDFFDAGGATHLDMLHNSPNSRGIAWDTGNAYWIFDGYHGSLTRYDFQADHGPGNEDHSDGIIARYAEGLVDGVAEAPSGLEMDHATGLLYVADSGHNRIAVLDTATGTMGTDLSGSPQNYDVDPFNGGAIYIVNGAEIHTLVNGTDVEMQRPSGLAMRQGVIYVTDNATSRVLGFSLGGELIDWLDLSTMFPSGSLMGLEIDASGSLLLVDGLGDRVVRIAAG